MPKGMMFTDEIEHYADHQNSCEYCGSRFAEENIELEMRVAKQLIEKLNEYALDDVINFRMALMAFAGYSQRTIAAELNFKNCSTVHYRLKRMGLNPYTGTNYDRAKKRQTE